MNLRMMAATAKIPRMIKINLKGMTSFMPISGFYFLGILFAPVVFIPDKGMDAEVNSTCFFGFPITDELHRNIGIYVGKVFNGFGIFGIVSFFIRTKIARVILMAEMDIRMMDDFTWSIYSPGKSSCLSD